MTEFDNKVAVITGGANGIGKCIVEEFRKNGAKVCIIDKAEGYLDMAIDAIDNELGVDVASSVLRLCLEKTGEITGKSVSNELVDSIFSKFCIGK